MCRGPTFRYNAQPIVGRRHLNLVVQRLAGLVPSPSSVSASSFPAFHRPAPSHADAPAQVQNGTALQQLQQLLQQQQWRQNWQAPPQLVQQSLRGCAAGVGEAPECRPHVGEPFPAFLQSAVQLLQQRQQEAAAAAAEAQAGSAGRDVLASYLAAVSGTAIPAVPPGPHPSQPPHPPPPQPQPQPQSQPQPMQGLDPLPQPSRAAAPSFCPGQPGAGAATTAAVLTHWSCTPSRCLSLPPSVRTGSCRTGYCCLASLACCHVRGGAQVHEQLSCGCSGHAGRPDARQAQPQGPGEVAEAPAPAHPPPLRAPKHRSLRQLQGASPELQGAPSLPGDGELAAIESLAELKRGSPEEGRPPRSRHSRRRLPSPRRRPATHPSQRAASHGRSPGAFRPLFSASTPQLSPSRTTHPLSPPPQAIWRFC